ncbi:MAG: hypothetical protein ABI165_08550, partial [Bryobacteraceae bacterium]
MTQLQRGMRSALLFSLGAVFLTPASGQTTVPNHVLEFVQNIPVPNWTNTGSTQANFDLFAFNPRTRVMYVADRTNKSITAIDTIGNGVIGGVALPSGGSTNGVLVVPELQKLVATDGKANVFVYDLRLPSLAPEQYVIPNITGGTDALDYDPLNRTVYVINGNAPYYMTGIDLMNQVVGTQLQLPGSPELMRFNPNDGLIYQVITDGDNKNAGAGLYAYDPIANAITAKYLTPGCVPHGIDIDPVTNVALLGCGTDQGQVMMDLTHGTIIKQFSDVTGTDLLLFNTNTRNFYTGSGSNVSTTTGCPADSTKASPVIGVFNSPGAGQANLVGVQCTGRNAHGLGVDTVDNFVYVGSRQYPVDAGDATTGQSGVLVYYDPAPRIDATPGTHANLASMDGKQNFGAIQFNAGEHRGLRGTGALSGVQGQTVLINVPTSQGNEVVPCGQNS